ncbi:aldolase catalytic domain-containing protein [Dysgonomonas termitidis]|uniref:Aldolase catalytic domain-containing protein n=1 Tax=Dysgonomonas termitidis TaxID=1516126 RepID=A0ABV9KZE6_9BACT
MINILDCTLRDGGYYTNWDFENSLVDQYIHAANILPIDYLEVGYRNNISKSYLGKYAYSPIYELERLRSRSQKKLAIMLNEKDTKLGDLFHLTEPIKGLVDMIRIAVDPVNIERAVKLAEAIKLQGYEVGFNVMYMSRWGQIENFYSNLFNLNRDTIDLLCMVDSFGGIAPVEVAESIDRIKERIDIPLGFHGHNNLELALVNTLTAIEKGVDFVDSTILGMGRGAGNLKTELLLTYLSKYYNLTVDFNVMGSLITTFGPLHERYRWGTNLPYMISGANSIPQKEVMEWVGNRIYSFNSIIRALDNKKECQIDNKKYPIFKDIAYSDVLIIGGGSGSVEHLDGIIQFIKTRPNIAIIHATSRNALYYKNIEAPQYFCLVGSEGERLKKIFNSDISSIRKCVLPPYPRIMGTDVPLSVEDRTFELESITFTDLYKDSCTSLALEVALQMMPKNIYIVGYDGYPNGLTQRERELSNENEYLFNVFTETCNIKLTSLTPSLYTDLIVESIYQKI